MPNSEQLISDRLSLLFFCIFWFMNWFRSDLRI
jgi:hypothetical protein